MYAFKHGNATECADPGPEGCCDGTLGSMLWSIVRAVAKEVGDGSWEAIEAAMRDVWVEVVVDVEVGGLALQGHSRFCAEGDTSMKSRGGSGKMVRIMR